MVTESGILGVKFGGQAPGVKISNFWPCGYLVYFGLHFFILSDRGYHVARCVKGWEDPLQNDPQNWGFENFWGRGTFWVWPLSEGITLILPVHIMGLSTLTNIVFILRESLSIWPRYGISNFQKAGFVIFLRIWGRLQWANGKVPRGQSLNGAR